MLSAMKLDDALIRAVPIATQLRHEIHAEPELAYQEVETARRVYDCIKALPNLKIQTGIAKTGIVATLNADRDGPCVALRAELDALPIQEATGAPYASRTPGLMHACGHDGHAACLVGAAIVLAPFADQIPGKVKFIWQPAEEGQAGGAAMLEERVLESPKVDAAFALHGWPYLPLGTVGACAGPTMASADFFDLTIRGVGGHAAYPHRCVDPIVIGAQIVNAAQTIAARTIDPLDAVVVSITEFHCGTANNIIAPTARLTGTIRALRGPVQRRAIARFRDIVAMTAKAMNATVDIEFGRGYPVLVNDDDCASFVNQVAAEIFGETAVAAGIAPCMGGEDFAFFAQRIPVAFWRLGVATQPAESQPTLHQPTYDFPDAAIPIGIRMHCELATRFIRERRQSRDPQSRDLQSRDRHNILLKRLKRRSSYSEALHDTGSISLRSSG
jgi:amidohydrolase